MNIKNEYELANVLGMAFLGYANKVQNGLVAPYKAFMNGADAVTITVKLYGTGEIRVEEGPDVDVFEAEIKNLKRKVKEAETEIQSLNVLLEKEKEIKVELDKERASSMTVTVEEPNVEEKEEKPKRKRKQK